MDQGLAARLDGLEARFERREQELAARFDRFESRFDRREQELVAYLDRRFSELETRLNNDLKSELKSEITTELRAEIAASAAETRRHFDVVADRLMDKIQLVGEGVFGVDQKLDRFRGEVGEEFRRVDRRLLRLDAKLFG